jgi:hypothetical protein
MRDAMTQTAQTISGVEAGVKGMEAGLRGLNSVLQDLGEKQIVIQQVKKKRWFSRD